MMKVDDQNEEDNFSFEKNRIVRKYFSRIFTLLRSDIRDILNNLAIDEEKKKEIKKELAFLPHEKQVEYLNEISRSSKHSDKIKD